MAKQRIPCGPASSLKSFRVTHAIPGIGTDRDGIHNGSTSEVPAGGVDILVTLPAASPSAIAQGGELRLDETWDLMRDTYGYEVDRITKVITIEEEGSGTNVIDTQGLRPLVRRQEGPVVHELRFPRRQDGGALAC